VGQHHAIHRDPVVQRGAQRMGLTYLALAMATVKARCSIRNAIASNSRHDGKSQKPWNQPLKSIHVPKVDWRYWAGILLASVFGTNLGDLYAHQSGLGLLPGVAVLAALTVPLFALEMADRRPHEWYYWLVIIVIRTGATNVADYLQFRARVPWLPLLLALAVMIALFASVPQRRRRTLDPMPVTATAMPAAGPAFWLAMLGCGVFGTVAGDVASHAWGQSTAAIALSAALGVAILLLRQKMLGAFAVYWLTVAAARSAGTAIGDWLAENHVINLGLSVATLLSGLAFAAVLLLGRKLRQQPVAG
jgi:uncharacterized membrane-anchored protein